MSTVQAPIDRFLLPKELQELLEDRVKTYNNMAQVFYIFKPCSTMNYYCQPQMASVSVVKNFFQGFGEIFR
jgi:hypothetical protein